MIKNWLQPDRPTEICTNRTGVRTDRRTDRPSYRDQRCVDASKKKKKIFRLKSMHDLTRDSGTVSGIWRERGERAFYQGAERGTVGFSPNMTMSLSDSLWLSLTFLTHSLCLSQHVFLTVRSVFVLKGWQLTSHEYGLQGSNVAWIGQTCLK